MVDQQADRRMLLVTREENTIDTSEADTSHGK